MAFGGVVNQTSKVSYNSTNSESWTNAQAIAAGDLIIIATLTQSSRTLSGITDPLGNDYTASFSNRLYTNKNLGIRWTRSSGDIAAGSTFSASFSGGSFKGIVMQSVSGTAASGTLDLAGTGNDGASGASSYTDASAHNNAAAIGFGAVAIIDGENSGFLHDARFSNVYASDVGGIGKLSLASYIVSATTAITKTDNNTGLSWIANLYWFKGDGVTPTASVGGRLLKGVG